MSKTCLNCGREISGEGKNKVFCNDCFAIMASFLRRLPKSDEPAMAVYERTKQNFPNMGISDKAAVYLEKCCKRYDEGMMNSQPSSAQAHAPTSAQARATSGSDEGDYPDPIQLPRRRRPAPMRDTPHPSDASYVSGLRYDINESTVNDKNDGDGDGDAGATQMFSYTERTPSYEEYQYREYSEAAAKVAAEEAAREAAARAKTAKQPERPPERQQRRAADEYNAGVRVHNDNAPNSANNSSRANKAAFDDSDDYSYAVITEDPPTDETKRRLYLILAAAAAAVILFAVLAFSGLLTGSRKPNPVGGSDSDSVSDDINNGAVVLPAESDSTEEPETTAAPDTTSSPVTTEPAVDPATCLHQWTAATCTEASVCTICGTVNGAPLGHSFSAPTCTEHGKCMRCGEVNTADTLAAHDYAPATCTDPQKCRMCGATKGEALGHEFSEPTCSEHGKCTRCGTVNKNDKLADHDYAAATCTEAQKCKVCGATNGDPLGHDYTAAPTFEWSDDLTCKYTLVCTRDKSHTTDGGAATVTHETTTPATCTTPGVETYTATAKVGGTTYMWSEKKTQEIPATGTHTFEEGSFVCSVCGEQFDGFESTQNWSGTKYKNSNLNIIVVSSNPSNFQYQLENTGDADSGDAIPEGAFRLIVKSGDSIKVLTPTFINAEEDRGDLFPNDAHYHAVQFDVEEGDEPLFYEYYESNFSTSHFWTDNRDAALYWKA